MLHTVSVKCIKFYKLKVQSRGAKRVPTVERLTWNQSKRNNIYRIRAKMCLGFDIYLLSEYIFA